MADSLVEYFSVHPDEGQTTRSIVAEWGVKYSTEQIKLMYLLFLPKFRAHAYPKVSRDRTAIAATPDAVI